MIVATVDTNVLASGFTSDRASPGRIINAWLAGRFELVLSEHVLNELARTLAKPYFAQRLSRERIATIFALLRGRARTTELTAQVRGIAAHAEDDVVIATAVSGGASYLVTGDAALLARGGYEGVTFVSPRVFIERLDATE